ncbi:peptide chain release factor 2 [Endomicrobiia bacterium]|nr:peptide chain release factor 2 [Endomicrobiia bacterium]GHT64239.1 peptide chain release factor 2 [Endomicrobiia bacterium]GHT70350.1 peptide chain release factor 2 [Endomicrobiia bacterium]GHT73897.1 peptide chain release factor 2 [Endomicrobiia bacterium]
MAELDGLKNTYKVWQDISVRVQDLIDLKELAVIENDENILKDVEEESKKLGKELAAFEAKTKLGGQHDKNNAIISIHAGAGGTESCDWVQMLLRMYSRWAEYKGFEIEVVDTLDGEEAGIKSITMIIKGEYSYGFLQSEVGVHRLVRISPFDSNKRRHTSFGSVDVIPEVDDNINIVIEDKDIRIDTYRASGAGGQHINKTDSAVRINHLPTGIIVQSQNDRSQIRNRATAMKLLKAKLYEFEQEKQRASYEKHYNEKGSIEWGSQIRSYVFMPYQLVKDHRTGYETSQVNLIMNGEIDDFISAYLSWKLGKKK